MASIGAQGSIVRRITPFAIGTAVLLSVPLLAMQFTDEVVWTLFDFAVAGSLLFGSGLVYVLATRNASSTKSRITVGFAVAAVLLLVWAELAVGVFETPIAGS